MGKDTLVGRAYRYLRPQYGGFGTSLGKPVPWEGGGGEILGMVA